MNGEPLPIEHGYPARLVVPGLYGYVSATKWVVDLELTRFDRAQAYWTGLGWSARGPIKTESRIDVPRSGDDVPVGAVTFGGVAWAQNRGVRTVEVRIDEGTWQPADLGANYSNDTWRLWSYRWTASTGSHTMTRARHRQHRRGPDIRSGGGGCRTAPAVGTPSCSRPRDKTCCSPTSPPPRSRWARSRRGWRRSPGSQPCWPLPRPAMPDQVAVVVCWLSGELPQRQIGVGWAALRTVPPPADEPTLTVARVDAAFTEIGAVAGKGSQNRRAGLLAGLFSAATAAEQTFLRRLLHGELRQGALSGVTADAVARAAGLPQGQLRRAAMLGGDLPAVAAAALTGGPGGAR